MTTEEDFQNHLDAHPNDHTARMVFADFLDDAGDPRAAGYRALGKLGRVPGTREHLPGQFLWCRFNFRTNPGWTQMSMGEHLPYDWYSHLPPPTNQGVQITQHPSRREAEDAAAHAFSKLPPERQSELLGHTTPQQMQRMARARRRMSKITSI
jgi:uncharacterized protein (TIGR02996 family)